MIKAEIAGIDHVELVNLILEAALERYTMTVDHSNPITPAKRQ